MTKSLSCGFVALAIAAAAGSAFAAGDISTVNSVKVEERIYNDFAGTTLTTTNNYPALVEFNEQFAQGEPGNFANKHVAWLSNDGGATRFSNNYWQSWTITFTYKMETAGNNGSPRKEGGLEIHNPRPQSYPTYGDEGQLLIASDGEVAMFGAAMPFIGFGNVYTLGTTATVSLSYFAPGSVDPTFGGLRLVFTDAVTGAHDSGFKVWGNETDHTFGLNDGTNIGFKDQNQRNPFIADGVNVQYGAASIVPAPASLALLGLAGLGARRRRTR